MKTARLAALILGAALAAGCGGEPAVEDGSSASPGPASSSPSPSPSPSPAADPGRGGAPAGVDLPALADGQRELHGTFGGERFWARLKPRQDRFGGKRVLELVYTPPIPEELGGTILDPHPFILVDDRLLVHAWLERGSRLTKAQWGADPAGYEVVREGERVIGDEVFPDEQRLVVESPPAWDLRVAPVLLAFAWRAGTSGRAPLVDLYGPRSDEELSIAWDGTRVEIAGVLHRVEPDADGRLERLLLASGKEVLQVAERQPVLDPATAFERERRAMRRLLAD